MFIGSEGLHIHGAVRLRSRWSPLCQRCCANARVRGRTFTNNMNIFLDNTQLHWIQWIYLINPIISFEQGFLCPLVFSFLTEIGVFVPGIQAASLRGWSPSQGDCYDHWCLCQPLAAARRQGVQEGKKKKKKKKKKKDGQKYKQQYTHILINVVVNLIYTQI